MKKPVGLFFVLFALMALAGALTFGAIGAFEFVHPGFIRSLGFVKSRPLHVSLVVAWIFLSAVGGIYYYLPRFCDLKLYSRLLAKIHLWTFLLTGVVIIICYFFGIFGGREYWAFPPILAIPIILSWGLFLFNYFKTVFKRKGPWPVYLWMWGTGILFFLITFIEAYLWVFPYFRNNMVRDVTTQWKAYGALVGSWNMLVYGTAIFVMERIKGDEKVALSKLSFLLYFLGLLNLMFGWAHHIYIVPSAIWIRYIAYAVSMTELLILARIIRNWKQSLAEAKKNFYFLPYRFIIASDVWIFLNLILAITISIPAVNIYTHGTHITVAHAMGSTIGINTMILLASIFFIVGDISKYKFDEKHKTMLRIGFWLSNCSLLVFWLSLICAGVVKAYYRMGDNITFQEIMNHIKPYLLVFVFSGLGILTGLLLVSVPAIFALQKHLRGSE